VTLGWYVRGNSSKSLCVISSWYKRIVHCWFKGIAIPCSFPSFSGFPMSFCPNCSEEYTGLKDHAVCVRCRKLAQPGLTETEKQSIRDHCGPCVKEISCSSDDRQISTSASILHRAGAWSGSASERRLNQQPAVKQNKNLQKGTSIIEARANKRKLSAAQILNIEMSLSLLYPNHKQVKVVLPPYGDTFDCSLTVGDVFEKLLNLVKEGFSTSAHSEVVQQFSRNAYADWKIHKCSLAPTQLNFGGSNEHLFMQLCDS
ncbi:hypothetical protein BT96DRAFT_1096501, partial [Gymnopus androsaceus JB14]